MTLAVTDVRPRELYRRSGQRDRLVLSIRDGTVTYRIAGVISISPFRTSIEEFAEWAQEAV